LQIQKPKQGYKLVKSLFGKYEEIPEEWNVSHIEDLGEIITGNTPDTSKKNFYGDEILWASPTDLGTYKYVENTLTKLSKKGFSISRKVPQNSILVVCIGSTIGKMGISVREMATNQQINSLICVNNDSEFVYYQLLKNSEKIKNMANHVAIPIINKSDFGMIKIVIPQKIREQQKIASILSNVDSLIQQTQKEIEQTQKLQKGLMQKLFTKGIGHTKFKKVHLGGQILETIPHNWNIKNLGEVSKGGTQNGLAISISDYGSGVPIVGMTKFYASEILTFDNMKQVNISKKDEERFSLKSFDLLFGRRSMDGKATGGAGKCIVVPKISTTIVFESSIIRMSVTNEVDPFFIYYLLKSNIGERIMWRIIRVSAVSGISSGDLIKIKIPIPPKEEQNRIVNILSENDGYINKLDKNKSNLEYLKKGLMQKLLTGQIRVKV
jgi:type I restriction enzyme S subunit